MYDLPPECPAALEHALLHLQNILDEEKERNDADIEQIYHEASIAFQIVSNMAEAN